MTKKLRIFIVDDHPLMRIALKEVIATTRDMCVVGEAAHGAEALRLIPQFQVDVVIMDLFMPQMDGLEAIQILKKTHPELAILVLSSATDEAKISQAVRWGAAGYLTKGSQRDDLIQAIRSVGMGEVFLPPDIAKKLLHTISHPPTGQNAPPQQFDRLTPRQQEIFYLLRQGQSDQEIANHLHISPSTVRGHLRIVMQKLGFSKRRELVVYALQQPNRGS